MLHIIISLLAQIDCSNVLQTEVFSDSEVAIRISSARMKSTTTKIIAPLMITEIIDDLNAPPFFSIAMDLNNYSAENKYFPFASVLLLVEVNINTNFGGCLHKGADMFLPS